MNPRTHTIASRLLRKLGRPQCSVSSRRKVATRESGPPSWHRFRPDGDVIHLGPSFSRAMSGDAQRVSDITARGSPEAFAPRLNTYVPALDGVRGAAIILVLLLHFTRFGEPLSASFPDQVYYRIMTAGWVGVDLFFVLSGGVDRDQRCRTRG